MTTTATIADYAIYDAGNVVLQSGRTFPAMKIAYKTFGRLNADRSNVIVYPTSFSAQHHDVQWLVREGGALDPSRYFIVIPNLFGNGLSSSPSNTPWPLTGDRYPGVTYHDAVRVQQRLLAEVFGISKVKLVYGWSMGAMQAYHWAAAFPELVERIAVVCGSARCAPHNAVFLEGVRAALTADPAYVDGRFIARPERGFRAMGRVYAGWALSQEFYREETWRGIGFSSLEDFLVRNWEANYARRAPEDLLAQLWTWQHGDISAHPDFGGDLPRALASIRARVLLMPGDHDLYFRVEDNRRELVHLKHAELKPIPSIWGHRAGNPFQSQEDTAFLEAAVRQLLET
jgi:homoserine O-acetyltransferase